MPVLPALAADELVDILNAVAARLDTITGLRVFDHVPSALEPPAAVVQLPKDIDFDLTAGRGGDTYNLVVLLLAAKADARAAHLNLAKYLDAAGPTSIKETLDGDLGGAVDTARVTRVSNVGAYTFAGVDYIGAEFDIEVVA